ncbi:MAG TPA: ABC transporter substrate-binding protein [Candidatus Methylomirabilis sp.]|nr:ABC transporter substrate-binding protein [Candidatus Methylomirabilis sp.]
MRNRSAHGTKGLTRRQLLKGAVGVAAGVGLIGQWRWARAQAKKPILIGLTCDATGTFADSGQAERRGMILAIEEFNAKGGVLGRPIEHKWEDTETDASVAVRKAQRLIERDKIDFMMGALSSGVAAPLSELAQRYGIIYFNSNSSSDTVTNEKCQRVNFAWDANNWMFANALGPLVANDLGKRWFLLTHDYVWGKNATAVTREVMKKVGAEELGELFIPQGARDFSAQLLRIRSVKPQVVIANMAGIEQTALREQAAEFGAERDAAWVFPQQDFPDMVTLGPKKSFGYFCTTWHYTLNEPGVKEFTERFRKRWSDAPIPVPDNVSCNGYLAARELLRAVERAGTTKSHEVIKALEGHVIKDNFRKYPSVIREWDHLVGQMLYLARTKKAGEMKEKYDMIEMMSAVPPEVASPPRQVSKCKMQSYAETPVYGG